ncbi:hypothetical protein DPMN_001981 [Dreissena polymorpha]|uniref:Uncharacterized protein n=1 Tax=Dreissena polymorpha TaxID=45954 RepID=A0A9D4RTG3_DREPO|nr:hypothetical protein DPMN_001981 [Dreissena polymorpha]
MLFVRVRLLPPYLSAPLDFRLYMEVKARHRNRVEQSVATTGTASAVDNIAQTFEQFANMAYMEPTVKIGTTSMPMMKYSETFRYRLGPHQAGPRSNREMLHLKCASHLYFYLYLCFVSCYYPALFKVGKKNLQIVFPRAHCWDVKLKSTIPP